MLKTHAHNTSLRKGLEQKCEGKGNSGFSGLEKVIWKTENKKNKKKINKKKST